MNFGIFVVGLYMLKSGLCVGFFCRYGALWKLNYCRNNKVISSILCRCGVLWKFNYIQIRKQSSRRSLRLHLISTFVYIYAKSAAGEQISFGRHPNYPQLHVNLMLASMNKFSWFIKWELIYKINKIKLIVSLVHMFLYTINTVEPRNLHMGIAISRL